MTRSSGPTRRTFLRWSALGVAGLACSDPDAPLQSSASGTSGEAGDGDGDGDGGDGDGDGDGACVATPAQTAGPFPQMGVERDALDVHGHVGVPFSVSGLVLDTDCAPIPGALVLLWHATPSPPGVMPATVEADPGYESAVYDHANQAGALTPDGQLVPTGEQMYYGWITADADGAWSFSSLRPGWYLNGARYRASHLHVKVFVDGVERLVTQLYFPDDPFNTEDGIFLNACGAGGCTIEFSDPAQPDAGTIDLHVP